MFCMLHIFATCNRYVLKLIDGRVSVKRKTPLKSIQTTIHVEYSRLFSGSICMILNLLCWSVIFLASTIVPLLISYCWPVGWQHRKPNIVASPRFSFPCIPWYIRIVGLPASLPYVLMPIQRSSVCSCMAGRRLSDDDFDFFAGAKELSDKGPLKKCTESLHCLLVSHLFFLSEKGINHTRTSPRLCMRCI